MRHQKSRYCAKHKWRKYTHGDLFHTRRIQTVDQRFWKKVERGETCWIWKGARFKTGYGKFWDSEKKGMGTAHRAAYTLAHGSIPRDLLVCHTCDNRICVRPDHLFLGTDVDNMKDMWRKGRGTAQRGEQCRSARLTEADVRYIRQASESDAVLAVRYDVATITVYQARHGIRWKHVA